MEELRAKWDALEDEQQAFVESLSVSDLARPVTYTSALFGNKSFELPLGVLMQHVANHATHHRSEIATMITMGQGIAARNRPRGLRPPHARPDPGSEPRLALTPEKPPGPRPAALTR
jgi:hypothetical protein